MNDVIDLFIKFCKAYGIDEDDAITFLKEEGIDADPTAKPKEIKFNSDDSSEISIFTDGACSGNGKKNSCGGIGVFYGDNDPRNVSEELLHGIKKVLPSLSAGKPTNNKAELTAILYALLTSSRDLENKKKLKVYSDSKYSIDCLTKWYKSWERNNWQNAKGNPVLNQEIIQKCLEIIKKYKSQITFIHVPSHQAKPALSSPKYFEWYGNHMADLLATQGCSV